jgi:dTDP-D-glucose 4,6-dehydratase
VFAISSIVTEFPVPILKTSTPSKFSKHNKLHDSDVKPEITEEFRLGDIRHAYGDISKAKKELGFEAKTSLEKGFKKLIEWSETQEAIDKFDEAEKERKKFFSE